MNEEFDLGEWAQAQPINLPEFKDPFPLAPEETPRAIMISEDGQLADAMDFTRLNSQIDAMRIALYKLTQEIHEADYKLSKAELEYERNYNRAYLSIDAKTEGMRRAYAQIMTEAYQNKVVTRKVILKDLNKRANQIAQSLDALKQMSFNFRKEVDAGR